MFDSIVSKVEVYDSAILQVYLKIFIPNHDLRKCAN